MGQHPAYRSAVDGLVGGDRVGLKAMNLTKQSDAGFRCTDVAPSP